MRQMVLARPVWAASMSIWSLFTINSLRLVIEEAGKKVDQGRRRGVCRGDGNSSWLLTACYGTVF